MNTGLDFSLLAGWVSYGAFFLVFATAFAIVTLGLNLQWGHTGLFNVGVAGFMAMGAYTSALLTTPGAPGHGDVGPELRQLAQEILDRLDPAVRSMAALMAARSGGDGAGQAGGAGAGHDEVAGCGKRGVRHGVSFRYG